MSHDTMPVHIRRADGVPVLASATAAQFYSALLRLIPATDSLIFHTRRAIVRAAAAMAERTA